MIQILCVFIQKIIGKYLVGTVGGKYMTTTNSQLRHKRFASNMLRHLLHRLDSHLLVLVVLLDLHPRQQAEQASLVVLAKK